MKRLAVLSLATVALSTLSARADFLNFNGGNATDWTSQFNSNNSGNNPSWQSNIGILDQPLSQAGGGLQTYSNPSIAYKGVSGNTTFGVTTGTPLTVSALVKGDWLNSAIGNGSGSLILGFGTDSGLAFAGSSTPGSSIAIRFQTTSTTGNLTWATRLNTTNANISSGITGSLTGLSTSNWYKVSATFTRLNTTDTWGYAASVIDFGTAGTSQGSTISSVTGNFTNTGTWNASSLYAGINFRSANTNPTYLDNFTAVPEPAITALALSGLCGAIAIARRRRAERS